MKIIEILPELDIGGVERHVIDLSNELAARGHDVLVISAGGQMQSQLSDKVRHMNMPVHKKNPFIGWLCSRRIAHIARGEGYQIIHAHSRVPAWIARWAANAAGIPYIVTAHADFGNKSPWIYAPYRDAFRVICVSETVREGMKSCFYDNTVVVPNGLDEPRERWDEKNREGTAKFLFIGRLSSLKGLQDVLQAMPADMDWTLNVLGDGPMRGELEAIVKERGFGNRVVFRGYSDKTDEFMADSSCLLFPSHIEGFGLVLARAVQIGLPVLAADIGATRKLSGTSNGLIKPGDIGAWNEAICNFIKTRRSDLKIPLSAIPTLQDMVGNNEQIYAAAIASFERGSI